MNLTKTKYLKQTFLNSFLRLRYLSIIIFERVQNPALYIKHQI